MQGGGKAVERERREPDETVLGQVIHGWIEALLDGAWLTYHGELPRYEQNAHGCAAMAQASRHGRCATLDFDVTGEPVPPWAVGGDPGPAGRVPPADHDVVDPPAPDEDAAPLAGRAARPRARPGRGVRTGGV